MEFLRLGQAAAHLGISVTTLRRWIEQGRIEAIRLPTTGERRVTTEAVKHLSDKMIINRKELGQT